MKCLLLFGVLIGISITSSADGINGTESPIVEKSECHYKGAVYGEGETILIEEPCLSCTCHSGALVCSLRVCPDLPNPPPPGCVILHKKNHCCPQLMCEDPGISIIDVRTELRPTLENGSYGCLVNGSIYSEGSALSTSTLCEYCYCIKGQQRCIKPHCVLPLYGCIANYREHSCCPTHYECPDSAEDLKSTESPNQGCDVNGTTYPEGDMMPSSSSCEHCYCMKGKPMCGPVRCTIQHIEGCYPVYTTGQCCPTTYNCSNSKRTEEEQVLKNMVRSFPSENEVKYYQNEETTQITTTEDLSMESTTEVPTTTEEIFSTTFKKETTTEEDWTTTEIGTEDTTIEMTSSVPDTTERFASTTVSDTTSTFQPTTLPAELNIITAPDNFYSFNLSSNMKFSGNNGSLNSLVVRERTQSLAIDGAADNGTQGEEDYASYDYEEPKLPPSLPNLVIYPFLAADAVMKEDEPSKSVGELSGKSEDVGPVYYKNYFSPPKETEGGFVPKDGILEEPSYNVGFFSDKDSDSGKDIGETPSITVPPKMKSENCISEGKEYTHGQLISGAGECISCVCFYGEVICQEANCPDPPTGCRRIAIKEPNSCCGKLLCQPETTTEGTIDLTVQDFPVLPPVTVADAIDITPDPFRDVIRTEPAPDLPSLMSDILPYLIDQQTKKPVSVNYKNVVVDYYPSHHITTMRQNEQKTTMVIEKSPVYHGSTEAFNISSIDMTSSSPIYRHRVTEEYFITTESSGATSTEAPKIIEETFTTVEPISEVTEEMLRASIRPVVLELTQPTRRTPEEIPPTTMRPTSSSIKPTILGIRPKPLRRPEKTTTTTESDSFFDEFLKGFFEGEKELPSSTMPPHPKLSYKYSSKVRTPPFSTSTPSSVEVIENREGEEETTGSFSLDSVLHMLFNSETKDEPGSKVINKGNRNKTSTKYTRRPGTRKPFKPQTVTGPDMKVPTLNVTTNEIPAVQNTTEEIRMLSESASTSTTTTTTTVPTTISIRTTTQRDLPKTTHVRESSFVTDQKTGFPKINILPQETKKPVNKAQLKPISEVLEKKDLPRKPTKPPSGLGTILKLAGCNIYGRMYRVGKIIAELSNACLECMCTDSGVQCSKLAC